MNNGNTIICYCYPTQKTKVVVTGCQHNPNAICRGTWEDECHDPSLWAYLLNSAYLLCAWRGPGLKPQCWHTSIQLKCPWAKHPISQHQAGLDLWPLWSQDKMFFYYLGTKCYIIVSLAFWTDWWDLVWFRNGKKHIFNMQICGSVNLKEVKPKTSIQPEAASKKSFNFTAHNV